MGSQNDTNDIAKISSMSLYNINKKSLQTTIKAYVKNYPNLKALKIVETLSQETYITVLKKNGNILYNQELPNSIKNLTLYKSISLFEKEKVGTVYAYFGEKNSNKLNQSEIAWIKNNPSIKIAVMREWKPFDMTDENNLHFGFHSDITNLINKKLSTNIVLVPFSSWKDAYTAATKGTVNAINSLSWTKQREKDHFIYSPPYHFTPYQIVVKKNSENLNSIESLKNKKIAVRTKTILQKVLEEKVPNAKLQLTLSEKESYENIVNGKSDTTLIANADEKLLKKYGLKVSAEMYHKSGELYIGTNKKYPVVASIIKKGLNSISLKEIADFRKKWFEKDLKKSLKDLQSKVTALNNKEISWIKKNNIIKVAVLMNTKPYDMKDKNNKHFGFHMDMINLINKKVNTNIVLVPFKRWKDAFNEAIEGKVHSIAYLSWSRQREEKYFNYSSAYNFTSFKVVVKKNNQDNITIKSLANKKIAIREHSISSKIIQEKSPSAEQILVKTAQDSYKSVSKGKTYATLIAGPNEEDLKRYNLKVATEIYHKAGDIHIGTNKKYPEVASIIQKGLDSLSLAQMADLRKKWFIDYVTPSINEKNLQLTKAESNWLKTHNTIKVGIQDNWAPLNYVDDFGNPKGLGVDFIKLLNKKLNGVLKIYPDSFKSNLQKVKNKKLDAMLDITPTLPREEFYHFTSPYITVPKAIVTQKNSKIYYKNEQMLFDKKVAIEKGYLTSKILKKIAPGVNIIDYDNTADALDAVSRGAVDAYVGNKAVVNHILQRDFITNLTFHARTKNKGSVLAIGVRKDFPILRDILDKALNSITSNERDIIVDKYVSNTKLKQKKDLNIAFTFDRPPFMFGKTSSKGIEADIVKEILTSQGYNVNIHQMSNYNMQTILSDNSSFDGVSTVSETNDKMYYTNHFIAYENYVITRKKDNLDIKSINDLSKVTFVAWQNAYNDLGKTFYNLFNPKNGTAKDVYHDESSQENQHKAFFNKEVDAIVVDKTIFKWYKLALKNSEKYTFHKIFPRQTTYPAKFKSKKVRDAFNKGLKSIKKSGKYEEIVDFYLKQDIRPLLKYSNLIADISGKFIFSHKPKVLENILKPFFKHPDVMHIEIYNNNSNKTFIKLHKDSHKKMSNMNKIQTFSSIVKKIYYTESGNPLQVGTLKVFYKIKNINLKQKVLIPELNIFTAFDQNTFNFIKKSYIKFGLNNTRIELTNEEKLFLFNNPVIRVHNEKSWPPFNFHEFGQPKGYSVDLMKLVAQNIGLKVEFVTGPTWNEFVQMLKKDELDVIINIVENDERLEYMSFTDPFIQATMGIAVNSENQSIKSFNDIMHKKVALEKGFFYHDYFNKNHPDTKLHIVDNGVQTLQSVAFKEADATIGFVPVMKYIAEKNFITGLKYFTDLSSPIMQPMPIRFSTRKDNPILLNILQKGLATITPKEQKDLNTRWLGESQKKKKIQINLTNKEKKWLKEHKNIKFTADPNYLPYEKFDNDGKYFGMVADYLEIIENTLGIKFEKIPTKDWTESLQKSKNKEIDVLSNYTDDETLNKIHTSTKPYILSPISIITDQDIKNGVTLDDLKGKKIAVVKGYGYLKNIFDKYPDLNYVEVQNAKEGLRGVSLGKYDAIICSLTLARYTISDLGLHNLHIAGQTNEVMKLGLGIKNEWGILVDIINKVISSISQGTKQEINKRWLGENFKLIKKVQLTKKEQVWIDKKIPIKYVFDPDWAPFEWKNELGEHTGIVYDLLSLVSERTGIILAPVPTNTWSEAVKLTQSKQVDMYGGLGETKERKEYMNFTKNILYKTPYVFVVHKNNEKDYFDTFNSLDKNEIISVVDGYTIHGIMKDKYPDMKLTTHVSTMEAFKQVEEEKIDIFIVNAATAKYYLNRKGFSNLKIATKTDFKLEIKSAIRNDWPAEVITILDKGLESISDKELADIYHKWTSITVEEKTDWILLYKIGAGVFIVIIFVLYLNRRLHLKVEEKTIELTTLLKSFDEHVIASKTDLRGIITYASEAFCEVSGYTQEELIGKPQNIVRHPKMPKAVFQDLWQTIKSGKTWKGEVKNEKKEGGYYWVEAVITPECNSHGKIVGYSAIRHDITAQKEVEEQTKVLNKQKKELEVMLNVFDEHIVSSKSDLEGHIISASKALARISGYEVDELVGQQHSIMRHPDMKKEVFVNLWDTIQSGKTWKGEIKNLKKDGGYFWVDALIEPEVNEEGKIVGYSAIRQDITSKKEVEELSANLEVKVESRTAQLKESEKRFVTLFDAAPDSIAIIKDGQYINCNQKTLELFGVNTHDAFLNTLPSDYSPEFQENNERSDILAPKKIAEAIEKGYILFEWKHKRLDINEVFDAEVILSSIVLGGEPHLYAVVRDITQRKLLEKEVIQNKLFLNTLLDSQEQIVITTDGKKLRSVNEKFLQFFNIDKMEEFTKDYDCICDRFDKDDTNTYIQKRMNKSSWIDFIIEHDELSHKTIIVQNGIDKIFSVTAAVMPIEDGTIKSAVFTDITELESQKKQTESILSSVLLPMLITSKSTRKIVYANSFAQNQYETSLDEILGSKIDIFYTGDEQKESILEEMQLKGTVKNFETSFKTFKGNEFDALLSLVDITYGGEECYLGVASDISEQKSREVIMQKLHKNVTDSIEYASLIQHSLIPDKEQIDNYFKKYFTIWHPKDIVGGDIYLFEELRDKNECLLMVIDCTGHGVPGAFVTMLVKAIERQVVSDIINSKEDVSPAKILAYFNKTMKKLLKQENDDAISNAGFDGGIMYYNKAKNLIRYAGAETPLFYIKNDELSIIKGNRHSIGYKKSDSNYTFTDHDISIDTTTKIYLTTDGYFDQNGGEKGFPFGKKRFQKFLENNHDEEFEEQKELLLYEMQGYQGEEERNDDITVVGLSLDPINKI